MVNVYVKIGLKTGCMETALVLPPIFRTVESRQKFFFSRLVELHGLWAKRRMVEVHRLFITSPRLQKKCKFVLCLIW